MKYIEKKVTPKKEHSEWFVLGVSPAEYVLLYSQT
jgi:hypothetical protein